MRDDGDSDDGRDDESVPRAPVPLPEQETRGNGREHEPVPYPCLR